MKGERGSYNENSFVEAAHHSAFAPCGILDWFYGLLITYDCMYVRTSIFNRHQDEYMSLS